MLTTGDKLLNILKEEKIGIGELGQMSKVPEFEGMCKIAEALGICVHELRGDEENYSVSVQKSTLAKLIVVSEINGVELEELIHTILEKGIEEHGFYG